jgi:[acyl-carrier-protein] S-malonyltransferase
MARAFVFPGQGSQTVGMGRELAEAFAAARDVFGEIDEALKQNLSRLMFEGPEADLTLTENAQPAIMAVSLAVMRVLESDGGLDLAKAGRFVAGHSLGEYSALAAAKSLTLADTARLLKTRGQAMQKAVPVGEGAMAALIGLDIPAVEEIAAGAAKATGGTCAAANDNAPGQVVVSGSKAAVEHAAAEAAKRGAKAVMLPVSAPFHCPLMQPAADVMKDALAGAALREPVVPLIANVTAEPVSDPDAIRGLLVAQVTAMVRWRESVLYMTGRDVDTLVEIGAGRVLSGLARRIDRAIATVPVHAPADIEKFLATV